MASNDELYNERKCKRSISDNHEVKEKEDNEYWERMSGKSETDDDNKDIEEIVHCPIHLGIMDDPRKLTCQHAFCYECLKEYVKTRGDLICPNCRVKERISDVDKLPPALTEKQLINVVMKHRLNRLAEESRKPVSLSDEKKEELVKHLLKGINTNNGIYKVFDQKDSDASKDLVPMTSYLESSRTGSSTSLAYVKFDIETIQENMLKHSKYKIVTRDAVKKIYKHIYQYKSENVQFNFSIFDINLSCNHSRSNKFVLVDSNCHKLIVYSDSQFRIFHVLIQGQVVKPEYIKILGGDLVMSGSLEIDGRIMSIFLQCNMKGEITQHSELYPLSDSSCLPIMLGFDFNKKEGQYYLCMPETGTIRIYDTSFVEQDQFYEFDYNRPEYVAYSSSQNQLWVSCPENKRILIMDMHSGVLRFFDTEKINKAIPNMIFVTDDDKILFLDTKGNRIIWIKRRNEYILTQRLNIPSTYRDLSMKTFQVLPFSMIIVGVEKEIWIFQSSKIISKSQRIFESCHLL